MRGRLTSTIAVATLVALAGCSKGGETPPGEGGGGQGTTTTTGAGGGSTHVGGAGTGGGGEGGAAPTEVDPADFEGIDVSAAAAAKAPAGCEGGFDAESGTLSLSLDAEVSALLLGVVGGAIHANGIPCSTAGGVRATIENTKKIEILGTSADETAIVDLATGGFGDELLDKGSGIHVDLGSGKDTFALRGSYKADHVIAGAASTGSALDIDGDGKADTFVSGTPAWIVSLGPGHDSFHGYGIGSGAPLPVAVSVFGGAGNDVIQGGAGDDALHGGDGDDVFETASKADGSDVFDGGEGFDTVDYGPRTAPILASMDGKADDGEAGEKDNVTLTIEALFGGKGDDVLTGGPGDDTIYGGPGNDIIHGGPGSDALRGEDGNDTLMGEAGDDSLYGDAGDDTLDGSTGDDMLDGGEGKNHIDAGGGDGDICIVLPSDTMLACELY